MLKDITLCAFQSLRKPLHPQGIVLKNSRNCIARVSHSPTVPHILVVSLQNLAQPNASDLLGVLMGLYSKARPTRVGSAFKWKGEVGFQREEWLSLKHRQLTFHILLIKIDSWVPAALRQESTQTAREAGFKADLLSSSWSWRSQTPCMLIFQVTVDWMQPVFREESWGPLGSTSKVLEWST